MFVLYVCVFRGGEKSSFIIHHFPVIFRRQPHLLRRTRMCSLHSVWIVGIRFSGEDYPVWGFPASFSPANHPQEAPRGRWHHHHHHHHHLWFILPPPTTFKCFQSKYQKPLLAWCNPQVIDSTNQIWPLIFSECYEVVYRIKCPSHVENALHLQAVQRLLP